MKQQQPDRERRREAGFSLIEMSVVLVLFSMALLVLLPNVRDLASKNRATDAVRQIQAGLQLARMLAINKRTDHVVKFTDTGWNIFRDTDKDGVKDTGEKWVYQWEMKLPTGIRYKLPEGAPAESPAYADLARDGCKCARFRSNGTLNFTPSTTTSVIVALGDSREYRRVHLSTAGAIKIQRWNGRNNQWE